MAKVLNIRTLLVLLLIGTGVWQTGEGGWIYAKAQLAQYLLDKAWQRGLDGDAEAKPWPWADTWPVAKLLVPELGIEQIVLQGDSGRTLAFGPGYHAGSVPPGNMGTIMISGHRDTHFTFLKDIEPGNRITLTSRKGTFEYRVSHAEILNADRDRIINDTDRATLVMVTCYPFDAITTGGNQRYVVYANLVTRTDQKGTPF
ncbi:MAG: class GN sortase [Gammaproteobacteria bacterium]|nr:MAG: class GN sortase [Gammaproteobacteria bacterium]